MPLPAWVALGFLAPHQLAVEPTRHWLVGVALAASLSLLLSMRVRSAFPLSLFLLAFGWTSVHLVQNLEHRVVESCTEGVQPVTGNVTGLPLESPGMTQFDFRSEGLCSNNGRKQVLLRVRWFEDPPKLVAGQRWTLTLRVKPARGRVNFSGPDPERSWFAAGYGGLATVSRQQLPVRHADLNRGLNSRIDGLRSVIRSRIQILLADIDGTGLVIALGLADRSGLTSSLDDLVRQTGTGHLLAISGLHIGLVAVMGYWLVRCLAMLVLPSCRLPPHHLASMGGLLMAGAYACLAGLGASTQRAWLMLAILVFCIISRRSVSPWLAWWLAMSVVLLMEPLSALSAGFWLSFGAVAALILAFSTRSVSSATWRSMMRAQWSITLIVGPLGVYWFQYWAPSGFLVNLAAIPWVSFVTLPLVLAGMICLPFNESLAQIVLSMAARSATWLEWGLESFRSWTDGAGGRVNSPGLLTVTIAMLGGYLWMAPMALRCQLAGLALCIPAWWSPMPGLGRGEIRLELLDVGQGLSALVQTRNHLILYDSGPGMPGVWDLHDSVIAPAILRSGRTGPDRILISHGDLDHAGGRGSLERNYGSGSVDANHRIANGCHDRQAWSRDGVLFDVLHPSTWLPYLGNDSSCVVSIRGPAVSLLLPGDISDTVERRLVSREAGSYPIVVAAHHGSRSSSSSGFLEWASPSHVLIPNGHGNRFGFPHREVMDRLTNRGIKTWSTADCGAISIQIDVDGHLLATSARKHRPAVWRWPAAPGCP